MEEFHLEQKMLQLFEKIEERYNQQSRDHLQKEIRGYSDYVDNSMKEICKSKGYFESSLLKGFNERSLNASVEMKQLAEGLDQPFMLFFMGMGKYGKSTLLNALLEQPVAEVDIVPKTWKIDIFEGRDSQTAVVIFNDGSNKQMSVQKCKVFLKEEEKKREISIKQVNDEFRKQAAQLNTIEEKEDLKKLLSDKMLYKSKIVEVRWPVKTNRLLKDFRLVDTPGLVQNLVGEVKVGIHEYYHKADGVIWLLDATKISAQKSRQLMDELNESLKHIGGRTDNIVAVLNSIDKVRIHGGEEAVADVVQEAKRIFGDLFQEIVPISAKEAFEGVMKNDKQLIERSGIRNLLQVIQTHFYNRAQTIQSESKSAGLKNVCRLYEIDLAQYVARLVKDIESYDKMDRDFEKAYSDMIKKMERGNIKFLEKYVHRVAENIERYTERLFDYSDTNAQKKYIQSTIFEFDVLSSDLKQLQKKYEAMLQEFWQYHSSKSVFKEYNHLSVSQLPTSLQSQAAIEVQTSHLDMDTSGLSLLSGAGMLIAGAAVLGPLGLVLAGIASAFGFAKWLAVKMKLSGVKKDLYSTLDDFITKLDDEIMKVVNPQLVSIHKKVTDIRCMTFASLHGNRDTANRVKERINAIQQKVTSPLQQLSVKDILSSDMK